MKIIANEDGVASGKIYNIGNPANNFSVRELPQMMLELARSAIPSTRENAAQVKLVETTADAYYGNGYQDVQNRVPKIDQHDARSRLEAEGRHGRRAHAHLRRLSRAGGGGAPAGRLTTCR